jgi:FtsH-binding integral membrane protein
MPPAISDYIGGLGLIILLFSGFWIIVLAFCESVNWGMICVILPFIGIYFAITRWHKTQIPFLFWLTSWGMMVISYMLEKS